MDVIRRSRRHRQRVMNVVTYYINDEFTTDLAAGSIEGTTGEPGPGTRKVTDPGNKFSLSKGWLKMTNPGAWDTAHLHYRNGGGLPRLAGLVLQFDILPVLDSKQIIAGWYNNAGIDLDYTEHCLFFIAGGNLYVRNGTTNTDTTYDYNKETVYRCRIVLQAAGAKFYVSGGDFGTFGLVYTLVHTDSSENSATLYPAFMPYNGDFYVDNVQVPISLATTTNTTGLDTALQAAITAYQGTSDRVHCAGVKEASWAATSNVDGVDGSGRTYICPTNGILQDGYIRKIAVNVHARDGTAWKFKVFRWNYTTTTYDYVGGEAFTPAATGSQEHTLSSPIAVQPGDIPALFIPDASNAVKVSDPDSRSIVMRVATGDISASNAFGTQHGDSNQLELDCLTNRPYLCVVGDSIIAGHGENKWYTWHDNMVENVSYMTSPGGSALGLVCRPTYYLRAKVGDGTVLECQNHAKGSIGADWSRTDGVPAALAAEPAVLILAVGINDLMALGSSWSDVDTDLDGIKTLVDAADPSPSLYVCDIKPASSASDAQAATIREWNANLRAWCLANSATFIEVHDTLAELRATTNALDDILWAYNSADNIHMSAAGQERLADLIYQALL